MIGNIGIIGGGVMGEVLAKRLISGGLANPDQIIISDQASERLAYLAQTYGVQVTGSNADALAGAALVIFAIKPQHAKAALSGLASSVKDQLFISIMAGVPLSVMIALLKTQKVVRSMPNMPAQIGQGMTVWYAAAGVLTQDKETARAVLRLLGQEVEAQNENMIDAATAVSGSGPAYVFDFAAHLIAGARALGFDKEASELLVKQTLKGSAELLLESPDDAATLRQKVTSKGGTTEAAFSVIDPAGLSALWHSALQAAYQRAKELGRELDASS